MGVNDSGLIRTITKDSQLQKKLVSTRKKRDEKAKNLSKISTKKKKISSDIQKMNRYNKELLKYEGDITKLIEEIRRNTERMEKYREKVAKEHNKKFQTLVKSIETQSSNHRDYLKKHTELSNGLNELSADIKQSVKQKEIIEYDVFLSHSNLDKNIFVSELSDKLSDKGLKIFEDIKVFKIGQSQTDMMNMGILNSRFVVVFLSPNFIKSGWSQYEFKSFLNREINEKRIIILPVWHDVSYEDVQAYNPYLIDKFALETSKYTIDEIVDSIHQAIIDSKDVD